MCMFASYLLLKSVFLLTPKIAIAGTAGKNSFHGYLICDTVSLTKERNIQASVS